MPTMQFKALKDVVPKYVNDAKPGKKFGSIKLADDTKYLYPASMNVQFKENVAVKIDTKTETWKDGPVEIITFKEFVASNGAAKQSYRQGMAPDDALEARKSLAFESYIRAGKISLNRDAIKIALDEIDAGCRMHANPQRRLDMNDEIPEGDWQTNSENPAN